MATSYILDMLHADASVFVYILVIMVIDVKTDQDERLDF